MLKKAINIAALILFAIWIALFGFEVLTASQQIPSEQQGYGTNAAQRDADTIKGAAPDLPHSDEQTTQRKTKQHQAAHSLKEFFIGFLEIKLTDLLIAIFTVVLAIKTSGLFRETAGLRDAAEKQRIDTLRSIEATERAANAAIKGARAAELNATALIDAERAHIYAVVDFSTLDQIAVLMLNDMIDTKQPFEIKVWYHLINHGRSPAIITEVAHGIAVEVRAEKRDFIRVWENIMDRREYGRWNGAMEIIEVSKSSFQISCTSDLQMSLEAAFDIVPAASKQAFCFYGRVFFSDSFGRNYVAGWEYMLRDGRWQLMAHKESKQSN
jgi:hypothetical protein